MQPTIHNLIKIFQLEISRGYLNRSVIGGFENLLTTWVSDAKKQKVPAQIINQVVTKLQDYHSYSEEKRSQTIRELLPLIQQQKPIPSASVMTSIPEIISTPIPTTTIKPLPSEPFREENVEDQGSKEAKESIKPHNDSTLHTKVSFLDPKTGLGAPLQTIPNVGPSKSGLLKNIGIQTLEDLLYYFPRKYDDYRELLPINRINFNQKVTVIGSVKNIHTRAVRNNKLKITEVILDDGTGTLRITFFNQPFLYKRLFKGAQIVVSGKTEMYLGRLAMNNPYWEKAEQKNLFTHRIVPIYKLTQSITQNWLRKVIDHTVSNWAPRVPDYFDSTLIKSAELMDLSRALYEIHNPVSFESLALAQERISFDEIFFLQLGILQQRRNWQSATSSIFSVDENWLEEIYQKLPYKLTNAQLKTISDIRKDFLKGIPMSRLVQGDVGSGKTMVAIIAAAIAAMVNTQIAIMAPTSILAEQHYKNFLEFFTNQQLLESDQIRLLIGNTPAGEKEEIRNLLAIGKIKIIIGTHALLENPIEFKNLEFAVIDEQHRFGVSQRAILRDKGNSPHTLVMTATPIPRSLALTIYGDLDISVMDEMPPGRKPVSTHIVNPLDRERVYQLINNQLEEGRQAFIIYPLVSADELEDMDEENDQLTKAAINEHTRLQSEIFREQKVGLLHGKMRADDKDKTMLAFKNKEIDILVSTTVVEVGVDIPNASVMLIEGANRFGLAQLHQLRGRVGRGSHKSYCLLIPENEDAVENERLKAMEETNDGFILAEKDLAQRGPGDFLGNRQSGYMDLRMANIMNVKLIEKARMFAENIFEVDPDLTAPQHQEIKHILNHYWKTGTGDIS